MKKKLTFSNDDVHRAVRKIGVLRLALWFLVITVPITLVLSATIGQFPALPLYLRAAIALCGCTVGLVLFIWKFIRMAQEDEA